MVGEALYTGEPVHLPRMALSVRQPWAWAILHAGKDLENRTHHSIRMGGMRKALGQFICIHAAQGMTRDEYEWGNLGVVRANSDFAHIPAPAKLTRGAVVGIARVVDVITQSTSPWFIGPAALRLADPQPIVPIPAKGELGLFPWAASGQIAAPLPWMLSWPDPPKPKRQANRAGALAEPELFPALRGGTNKGDRGAD